MPEPLVPTQHHGRVHQQDLTACGVERGLEEGAATALQRLARICDVDDVGADPVCDVGRGETEHLKEQRSLVCEVVVHRAPGRPGSRGDPRRGRVLPAELWFRDEVRVQLVCQPAHSGFELALLDPTHETIPAGYGGNPARGVLLNLEVEDVDALHAELSGRDGVEIVLPLRSEEFGQRHFIIAGPDGVLVDVITPIEPGPEFAEQFVARRDESAR